MAQRGFGGGSPIAYFANRLAQQNPVAPQLTNSINPNTFNFGGQQPVGNYQAPDLLNLGGPAQPQGPAVGGKGPAGYGKGPRFGGTQQGGTRRVIAQEPHFVPNQPAAPVGAQPPQFGVLDL